MDYVRTYGNLIAKVMKNHPVAARRMVDAGLTEELVRLKHFPPEQMPKGLNRLNYMAMKSVRNALREPEKTCWVNILAPVEILQCFGLNGLSIECVSSFMSGFKMEDYFLNEAESTGIAPTLCSYHRNFIGIMDYNIFPNPVMSVTTSLACDGNISTFRQIERKQGVPLFVIDVPYEYNEDTLHYVTDQLTELIHVLEEKTGKKFDIDLLREKIACENRSKRYYRQYLTLLKDRYYPKTLTLELFILFATHLYIGMKENEEMFRQMRDDAATYPMRRGKAIFWSHLVPYYQETLQRYFNYQEKYYIQAIDFNMDYMGELDVERPIEALARKILLNIFNGSYERKAKMVVKMARKMNSDAVIAFCHWGCKQSSGGVNVMRQKMREAGIPFLVLDGDAVDRRNSHDGQIRTRLEAFLEMLDNLDGDTQLKGEAL